jgi:hypothetical protein
MRRTWNSQFTGSTKVHIVRDGEAIHEDGIVRDGNLDQLRAHEFVGAGIPLRKRGGRVGVADL